MNSLKIPTVEEALAKLLTVCASSSDRRTEFVLAVADAQSAMAQAESDRYAEKICHYCYGTGQGTGERSCWACRGRGTI